jgi:multidrug efflux pump subunit AcrA (membrane-fusion protein)
VTIIASEHKDTLTLPREAVRQDEKGSFVFAVVNQELERRNVQTGISDLTRIEITNGVSDSTQIALSATNSKNLHDHLQVKINQ